MTTAGIDEHLGRVLGSRYRLLAPIGSGGSAQVYLAEDQSLGRRVAVKLLHPGLSGDARFARRFESEARSAAQLNHPHILAVYDWSDGQPAYLVSELLEGGSLWSLLRQSGPVSPSQALLIGLHTATGLAYAHAAGFVHRDIKPANLLFDRDGRVRIADFGIARAVAEATWTEPGGVMVGTARYAAPEQSSGGPVDGRADVYSLALSLVEAVTGTVPLLGPTALATMVLRQDRDLEAGAELGPLRPIIDRAGRADPSRRPDAATFAVELHGAASQLPRPKVLPLARLDLDALMANVPATVTGEVDPTAVIDLRADRGRGRAGRGQPVGGGPPGDDTAVIAGLGPVTVPTPARRRDDVPGDGVADDGELGQATDEYDGEIVEVVDRRRRWPFAVLLVLLVVAAVVAYQGRELASSGLSSVLNPGPDTRPMGSFVGRPIEAVLRDLDLNGWTAEIQPVRQDDTEPGQVLSQAPDPGVEWELGAEVVLVVSEGQVLRTVPVVVGLIRDRAEELITEARLVVGDVVELHDEDVPLNQVMSSSLSAGDRHETGTAVDLVISAGPIPRVVATVAEMPFEAARAMLEADGLVVVPGQDFSRTVPEGQVIGTVPEAGATVARGTEIEVIVSRGRPFVVVPDVSGMTASDAADRLAQDGFVVRDVDGDPRSEVIATNPPAGESHRLGTGVTLFTR